MSETIIYLVILFVCVLASIYFRKVTPAGGICGGLFAIAIYCGAGWGGIVLLAMFFVTGTSVTKIGSHCKAILNATDNESGTRDVWQVVANGGMATLLSLAAIVFPGFVPWVLILISCAFSAATADTVSSELGVLYGKNFRNILTFRADRRGENGAVSLEGFLFGLAGSLLIAFIYVLFAGVELRHVMVILVAGTAGNIVDSILGATLERSSLIGNNTVNFLNTLAAVLCGALLLLLLHR